uniref:Uncharacterized protein n=1 Tax=Oryza rufipogon TaxID=4529 RepID=A0A0E0QZG7_ORYRU
MDEERDAVLVGFSPSVWVVADIPGATSRTERRGTEGLATTGFQASTPMYLPPRARVPLNRHPSRPQSPPLLRASLTRRRNRRPPSASQAAAPLRRFPTIIDLLRPLSHRRQGGDAPTEPHCRDTDAHPVHSPAPLRRAAGSTSVACLLPGLLCAIIDIRQVLLFPPPEAPPPSRAGTSTPALLIPFHPVLHCRSTRPPLRRHGSQPPDPLPSPSSAPPLTSTSTDACPYTSSPPQLPCRRRTALLLAGLLCASTSPAVAFIVDSLISKDHASTGWDGGAASTDPFCQASWLTVCRA